MLVALRSYPDLIVRVLRYEHRVRAEVEQHKAVVQLADGSRLHLNEVWIAGSLQKYAYYWLTPTDEIIRGWDNAPHHPEVDTYPHHVHHSGTIHPSSIRSHQDVLLLLNQYMQEEE
jgi:hypothetical protein